MTASQFNTPDNKAEFARTIEAAITVPADVTNVVATDVSMRRTRRRQLLASPGTIDVGYTLSTNLDPGVEPAQAFNSLVTSLTSAVTSTTDGLAASLSSSLGVTLDPTAYTEPNTYAIDAGSKTSTGGGDYDVQRLAWIIGFASLALAVVGGVVRALLRREISSFSGGKMKQVDQASDSGEEAAEIELEVTLEVTG